MVSVSGKTKADLEAMLSSKPVVTCTDSGGPLEFIRHGDAGWVEAPNAEALAARLHWIAANPREAVVLSACRNIRSWQPNCGSNGKGIRTMRLREK